MKRLILYTKPFYFHMLAATIASIGVSAATVLVVDLLRQIIDSIAAGGFQEILPVVAVKMVSIIVMGMFSNYLVVAMTGYIGSGLLKNLRKDSLQHLMQASPDFMNKNNFGDVMERMSSDVEELAGFMQGYFKDCLYVPVIVIVYSVYLLRMNLLLALACLLPLAVLVPISIKCLKPIKLRQFQYAKELGMTNNYIQEAFDGMAVIKSYQLQKQMEQNYYDALKKTYDTSNETDLRQYNIEPVSAMIREVPMAIALCMGGYLVFTGAVTVGVLIAYISIMKKLIEPLSMAYQLVVRSQTAIVSIQRVFSIMDIPSEDIPSENIPSEDISSEEFSLEDGGDLTFHQVSFSYGTEENATLEKLNFSIPAGSKTALVGRSGGGKSTILKLIARQLEADTGTITYGNVSYSEIAPAEIRAQMALISQEAVLFPMSVMDNVRIGNPRADKAQIQEALRLAGCSEFVEKMPEGMDSILAERGENLSGGQRQRLAIARAIVKEAPILLLDEPTSALDRNTELFITETIDRISAGKTVITVAHRLPTIRDYDQILVIDQGSIVERGTQEELMQMQGLYYEMYQEFEQSGGTQQ